MRSDQEHRIYQLGASSAWHFDPMNESDRLIPTNSTIVDRDALLELADRAYLASGSSDRQRVIEICDRLKLSKAHAPNFGDHEFEHHAFRHHR